MNLQTHCLRRRALFFVLLACHGLAVADEHLLSAADVFELEYANNPQLSPDGSTLVYERRSNDIMTDSTRSTLWLVDVDSGDQRPLVSGLDGASSPLWSPDGNRIAWLAPTAQGTGIFVRWMDGGQTALLTTLRESPSDLAWSPDGDRIAFVMSVPGKTEPLARPPAMPEGAVWAEPVKTIDSVLYRRDGQGFVEPAHAHVFVIPATGGTPRQLTDGNFMHSGPLAWSADGSAVYFSANRNADWEYEPLESDLWSVRVADRALQQLTDRPGGEIAPVMSPDGRRIAYLAQHARREPYRNQILHIMDIDGGGDRALTAELDRSVGDVRWPGNGRNLYVTFDDRAQRIVARVALDGSIERLASDLGGTSLGRPYLSGSYTVAADGTLAYTRGTHDRPADIALLTRRGARLLTQLNEDLLADRTLADVHEISYASSADGLPIQGWYLTPPDYEEGKRYPLILEIHGGPHLAYGPQFSAEMQRFAAAGYVVFYNNHRGSSSYGEEFALALKYKYSSEDDFADHMSGIDALIDAGVADPAQLYITGGSAGGIASAYAIGLTDRFRAAAVAKPVINWVSKTLTADSYVYQTQYQFPGMPWEVPEHYWERSPLSLVGNVTTPTLLITGEDDQRTPISETEQFYQALKLRRIDTVMIRVPGSPHGIAGKPSRLNAKVDNILAWFERYRGDDSGGATGSN